MKIKKRDVLFFLLGLLSFLVFDIVSNWDEAVTSFNKGYNAAREVGSVDK